MPGPGHYFGKEPVSTFSMHSPSYTIPMAGSIITIAGV